MKKRTLIAVLALLGVSAAIGTTVAFLSDSVNFNNDFRLAEGETEFVETFKSPDNWKSCDTTPKELVITNKSDVPVVARFKMEEYWKRNGSTSTDHTNEISPTYQGHKVAVINFQNQNDWEQKGEWYVYKNVLQKNESTSSLLASVTFNCDINMAGAMSYSQDGKSATTGVNDYANAHFHLNIAAQTIQSGSQDSAWTVATFKPGSYETLLGKNSSNQYRASFVQSIEKAAALPDSSVPLYDATDAGSSDKAIKMWLSNDGETLYWFSEANEVYFPPSSQNMFSHFGSLKNISGFSDVNMSLVTNMAFIFQYSNGLTDSTSMSNWDVSHVTNFSYAFANNAFSNLNGFQHWDMSSATNIQSMFNTTTESGAAITDISPIANWSVSNVTSMEYFMSHYENIDASVLENWDIKPTTNGRGTAFSQNVTKPTWAQ